MYLGVDIGGTAVKLGIVEEKGNILYDASYDINFDQYRTPIMDTVIKGIHLFLTENHVKETNLQGIGVSATGQIDTKKGTVIGGNIESWINVNIKKQLEDEFHMHTTVINDANAMIVGESWIGAAKNKENVIGITIGTGVGGGILVDGNILLGDRGIAGELGHFIIVKDGTPCFCGNAGCYERYAATTALIQMVQQEYTSLGIKEAKENIDGKLIFSYAEAGNKKILEILDAWLDYIATGLVSLIHIFNPESVVIGGGVCQQDKLFMEPLRNKVMQRVMPRFKEQLEIKAATLKNNAGLVGAVQYNIQHSKD